jgi:hypothetical protein
MAEQMEEKKRRFPVVWIVLGVIVLAAAAFYAGGIYYYQNHFINGTVIDRVDVSGMTIEEVEAQAQEYFLNIIERKSDGTTLEEDIQGKEIGLAYASTEPLQKILKDQNVWGWFLRQEKTYDTENLLTYEETALKKAVLNLHGFQTDFAEAPTDAYIADYTPEDGFVAVEETQGNLLNEQKTLETIRDAVEQMAEQVDLDASGCYEVPEITLDNEALQAAMEQINQYGEVTITYTFGDNKEVLDGKTIQSWLAVDGFEVSLDQDQVKEYVATLRKRYDTIFRSRTFVTTSGTTVTIDGGDYGWWMNYEQEALELEEMIENGESGERTPVYYQTAEAYGTPDYGTTYVEINLTAQHMYFYQDGSLILESDFVSGNSSKGYDTPAGVYGITYKQRNATLVGENYATPVSYWMPFNKNIGLHDATWRKTFGGNIYKTSGSHGCINLPYSVAQELYGYIEQGTPVICYYLPGTEPKVKETTQETTQTDASQTEATETETTATEAVPAETPQESEDAQAAAEPTESVQE